MRKALTIILLAALWLLLYPLVHEQIPFLKNNLRTYSINPFSNSSDTSTVINEALLATAVVDTQTVVVPDSIKTLLAYNGLEYLTPFYTSLHNRNAQTRIAYYGDSQCDGDQIIQTIRDGLQRQFGGYGVGFVPITSVTAKHRGTIRHHFSDNWETYSFVSSEPALFPIGIHGSYFKTNSPVLNSRTDTVMQVLQKLIIDTATQDSSIVLDTQFVVKTLFESTATDSSSNAPYSVHYQNGYLYKGVQNLAHAHLFYGNTQGQSNTIAVETQENIVEQRFSAPGLLQRKLISNQNRKDLKLNFQLAPSTVLYGMSFESPTGVIVDNLSTRGNTGLPLTKISGQMLQAFNSYNGYDLIVLHFGLNTISERNKNYDWYERGIRNVVRHFKRNLPNAPILIIGVNDKSKKINGKMQTHPDILSVLDIQRRIAMEEGCAFYSLFHAMGGLNSMVKWVEEKPAFANQDYTHFNPKGGDKIGKMLTSFLLSEKEQK